MWGEGGWKKKEKGEENPHIARERGFRHLRNHILGMMEKVILWKLHFLS